MERNETPKSTNDLLAAMADGELDMRANPDALAELAKDPQAAQRVAYQQQLKQACSKAMDGPEMKCPDALAAKLRAIAFEDGQSHAGTTQASTDGLTDSVGSTTGAYAGPPVIARIGRWVPAAAAAVLLIVAGILFTQANPAGSGVIGAQTASFLPIDKLDRFTNRHGDCAMDLELLKDAQRFGNAAQFDQLPGKLADHFKTSTDGLALSLDGIGYEYQLTGACPLPGEGAVHIIYRHHDDSDRSISLWIMPASDKHASLEPGQVYSMADEDPMHPVIIWKEGELTYFLVGDSLEDCDKAVKQLRQAI